MNKIQSTIFEQSLLAAMELTEKFKNTSTLKNKSETQCMVKFLKKMQNLLDQIDVDALDTHDDLIQYNNTTSEMKEKAIQLIKEKRSNIDKSNQIEFTQLAENDCARTNAADINRNIQMKLNVVHNESGPLDRSTMKIFKLSEGVEERIKNIEDHLNLDVAKSIPPMPISAYTRIKALEERIILIENGLIENRLNNPFQTDLFAQKLAKRYITTDADGNPILAENQDGTNKNKRKRTILPATSNFSYLNRMLLEQFGKKAEEILDGAPLPASFSYRRHTLKQQQNGLGSSDDQVNLSWIENRISEIKNKLKRSSATSH